MKKIALIILSLFVVFISSDSFAQRKGGKKMEKKDAKIEKEVANLTQKLSLTSAQVPEVTAAVRNIVEVWVDGARKYERMGEFIERIGWPKFFELTDIQFTKYHIDDFKHAGETYTRTAQIRH